MKTPLPLPSSVVLVRERVRKSQRIFALFGAGLFLLCLWDLNFWPYFFMNLPPLGWLGLPFFAFGVVLTGLFLTALAIAVAGEQRVLRIDRTRRAISDEWHFRYGIIWPKRISFNRIKRLEVVDGANDNGDRYWSVRARLKLKLLPYALHNFSDERLAREAAITWWSEIKS